MDSLSSVPVRCGVGSITLTDRWYTRSSSGVLLEVWPESQFARFLALSNRRIIVASAVMMYAKRPNDPFMRR